MTVLVFRENLRQLYKLVEKKEAEENDLSDFFELWNLQICKPNLLEFG